MSRRQARSSKRKMIDMIAFAVFSGLSVMLVGFGCYAAIYGIPVAPNLDAQLSLESRLFDQVPNESGVTAEQQIVVHINDDDENGTQVSKYAMVADMTGDESSSDESYQTAGSRLTGSDKLMYDILNEHINAVAEGEERATAIEIPVDELGLGFHWTASELGVDSIVDDGLFADGVTEKLVEKESVDLQRVVDALYHDNPYAVYWIDKNQSGISSKVNIASAFEHGEYVCFQKSIYISFAVTNDTRDKGVNDPEVAWSAIKAAQEARANARAIIEKYKDLSDMDKLRAYQQEICNLTAYEESASADNYGNVWQMTHVFDGDPDTNAVCEGYSKAFQFLCNETSWDGDVQCYTATGTVTDGQELNNSPHMWNIVRIDGKTYMADITNSDEYSIGQDGSLFLARPDNGNALSGYDFRHRDSTVHYDYSESVLGLFDSSVLDISMT